MPGRVFLFEELCPLGSVESYLKANKSLLLNECSIEDLCSEPDSLNLSHLQSWSLQTAQGMRYLSEHKIIHGDLAIRNLLLKDINTIKISDFGLARQLNDCCVYKKTQIVRSGLN